MLDGSAFSALKGRSITRVSIDPEHSFSECWWLLLHTSDGACFELYAEPVVTWGWEEANEVRLRPKLHPSEPVAASQSVDIHDFTTSIASADPMILPPMQSTLVSECERASQAQNGSCATAAKTRFGGWWSATSGPC